MELIQLSTQGKTYNQKIVKNLTQNKKNFIFIYGHYEGFDAHILNYVDRVIFIGDYLLMGDELAACFAVDRLVRLLLVSEKKVYQMKVLIKIYQIIIVTLNRKSFI